MLTLKSEANFCKIIEKSPDAIVIVDRKGIVDFVNSSAESLFGHKAVKLIGNVFGFPLVSGETTEIEIISAEKEVRFGEMRVVEVEWEHEYTYLATIRDITEKKKADEFIKSILESIGEGLVVVDRHYRIIAANKAYCNQVKMPIEDIQGKYCYEVSHKIDMPCYKIDSDCPVRNTFTTGQIHTCIHKHTHFDKEGVPFYVETRSYPMKDPSGHVISAIEVITDITKLVKLDEALKKKVKELQESEERFRKISVTAHDAIIMMDSEGNISYWNKAAERIFEYSTEEVLGKALDKIIIPDQYKEAHKNGIREFKETGRGAAIGKILELSAIKKDGTEFPIELSVSAVKIKGNWNAIGILRDITDRKRAEEYHAAIGRAITQIAHGTKNILNALQGGKYMVETALGKNNMNLLKEGWDVTKIGISRMQNLTRDLLDCSRFNKLDLKPAYLNLTIQEVIDLFRDSSETDIEVFGELDTSLPEFMLDHNAIHSALMNLISNAIDSCRDKEYEEGAKGKVFVRTFSDNENIFANLQVEDNGKGIKPEEIEKIFDLFYSTKASKGNGLGLPITKKVVEQHGGSIEVNSELGKGTTFLIRLPLKI